MHYREVAMRSVRLDEDLEAGLEYAARPTGVSIAAFICDAIRRRFNELFGDRMSARLADVAGAVASHGRRSRRTGQQFLRTLKKQQC